MRQHHKTPTSYSSLLLTTKGTLRWKGREKELTSALFHTSKHLQAKGQWLTKISRENRRTEEGTGIISLCNTTAGVVLSLRNHKRCHRSSIPSAYPAKWRNSTRGWRAINFYPPWLPLPFLVLKIRTSRVLSFSGKKTGQTCIRKPQILFNPS